MENTDPQKMLQYRIKLFRDTHAWKKPDRIPFNSNMFNWMFIDAGYTTAEASRNYELLENILDRFLGLYKIDGLNKISGMSRNPFLLHDALGGNSSWGTTDSNASDVVAIFEDELIKSDEYDELIADANKVLWEKAFFRHYPKAKDFNAEQFKNALCKFKEFNDAKVKLNSKLRDVYGIPIETNIVMVGSSTNLLMNSYRGIKGFAIDMRRNFAKVKEFVDIRQSTAIKGAVERLSQTQGYDWNETYDVHIGYLDYTIMNTKQFEALLLPTLDAVAKACEKYDKQAWLNTEGSFERFGDYFNNYRRGVTTCSVEMDDPFVIREKYPNIGIVGGISLDVLGKGTPQQCVDMAKKSIDELGRDGGFVLSPNKFVTYKNDMRTENLKAVGDFAEQYRG